MVFLGFLVYLCVNTTVALLGVGTSKDRIVKLLEGKAKYKVPKVNVQA